MEKKLSVSYKKSDLDQFDKIITNKQTDQKVKEYSIKEAIEESKKEYSHLTNSQVSTDMRLYMFQTGTLKTKMKYIKMNQSNEDFEIPVPWFLIRHPKGDVVIDGGNAKEVSEDKHAHWGSVVAAYDPIMGKTENCIDQLNSIGVNPAGIRYVLHSHLHLDHSGGVGRLSLIHI